MVCEVRQILLNGAPGTGFGVCLGAFRASVYSDPSVCPTGGSEWDQGIMLPTPWIQSHPQHRQQRRPAQLSQSMKDRGWVLNSFEYFTAGMESIPSTCGKKNSPVREAPHTPHTLQSEDCHRRKFADNAPTLLQGDPGSLDCRREMVFKPSPGNR